MGTVTVEGTQNGGKTWTHASPIPGANGLPGPLAMDFPTASDGWLIDGPWNGPSVVLHTTNGGRSFAQAWPLGLRPETGISFVTPELGYGLGVIGDSNAVLRTTDGGRVWARVGAVPGVDSRGYFGNPHVSALSFVSATRGYAVSPNGRVYETTDGGRVWRLTSAPAVPYGYSDIWFANANLGVAGNSYYAHSAEVTTNGGRTWSKAHFASFAAAVAAYANPVLRPTLDTMIQAESTYWDVLRGGVAFMPAQNGRGYFFTKDNGALWTDVQFPQTANLSIGSMDFVNPSDGWLLTFGGRLFATRNGGQVWFATS